jgi:adenylate cyclase
MSTVVSEPLRRLRLDQGRIARALRSATFKALIGANIFAAGIILIRAQGWLQPLELLVYDALRVVRSGHQISDRLLLIAVTESDIGQLRDKWPLTDQRLADLLERIASWQPRVIAVDIYRDFPRPPGTEQLAKVLAQHPNILWGFKLGDAGHSEIPPPQPLRGTDRAVLADTLADPGRVVRRALLFADDGKEQYTGMGTALALGWLVGERIRLQPGPDDDSLRLGKGTIAPLDATRGPYVRMDSAGYQMLLDYRGGPEPFPHKSLGEFEKMDRNDAAALVRGRAVIVGGAAESVQDYFSTPFSTGFNTAEPVWGSSLHAHVAEQLIRQALDGTPSLSGLSRHLEDVWIWLWALAGLGLGLAVRSTLPAVGGGFAGLAVIAGIVYVAFGKGLLLPALPAAIVWLGSTALTNQLLHAASNRARTHLRKAFEHYLPPVVIAQMLKSDTLPTLGGERREISVLFTDVASFTTLSEEIEPEFLSSLCSEYFEGVCAAIFEQGGLVNEFIGDAVLAFFGAPHPQPDHADRAVSAALGIDAFASRFSAEQRARGINFLHTRIGVHTGAAMVGNFGSRSRLKYSAQGDMMNTGSRLEGLNKTIGTRICVSGDIVRKSQRHHFRPIGAFVVKGRHGATEVFEPLGSGRYRGDLLARYEAAFRAVETGRPEAVEQFTALRNDYPEDPCVAFHCQRLAAGESGTLIVMTEK